MESWDPSQGIFIPARQRHLREASARCLWQGLRRQTWPGRGVERIGIISEKMIRRRRRAPGAPNALGREHATKARAPRGPLFLLGAWGPGWEG